MNLGFGILKKSLRYPYRWNSVKFRWTPYKTVASQFLNAKSVTLASIRGVTWAWRNFENGGICPSRPVYPPFLGRFWDSWAHLLTQGCQWTIFDGSLTSSTYGQVDFYTSEASKSGVQLRVERWQFSEPASLPPISVTLRWPLYRPLASQLLEPKCVTLASIRGVTWAWRNLGYNGGICRSRPVLGRFLDSWAHLLSEGCQWTIFDGCLTSSTYGQVDFYTSEASKSGVQLRVERRQFSEPASLIFRHAEVTPL